MPDRHPTPPPTPAANDSGEVRGAPRYPIQPLLDATGLTVGQLCNRHHISGATALRGLTERTADRVASALDLHVYVLWPEMAQAHIEAAKKLCADEACDTRFLPSTPTQKFCSPRCKHRTHKRKARATPEGAERSRARRRRYYAENGEYERARQRRAYWADPDRERERQRLRRARGEEEAA